MKLIMTLLVRDEQDIIRENIEFHLARGVDFIIVTDNRSVDATTSILREYESRGLLHYIYEADDDYNQRAWVTRMARLALTEFGADWVINSDADEFWWPMEGDLNASFDELPSDVNIVQANRTNFVATGDSGQTFWSQMVYRERVSLNSLGRPLPPKVAHRGLAGVSVAQGNHSVAGFERPVAHKNLIEILHFPVRSAAQITNKISKGGAAYEKNTDLDDERIGSTWRELYESYKVNGNLDHYYRLRFVDQARLAEALSVGELVEDTRLCEFFRKHGG